jgi:RimJ/RimL family protein N-acetyltransferase
VSLSDQQDAPVLVTERLELWRPRVGDLPGLIALMEPEEIRTYLGPMLPDASSLFARLLRGAGSWSLYGYGGFTVRLIGDDAIIGNCGVFHSWRGFGQGLDDVPEAGWIVAFDHWGKGVAGEAMHAALSWFDATHGRRRIACMIEDDNTASHRLAKKLGFDAYGRQTLKDDGAEVVLYERLP